MVSYYSSTDEQHLKGYSGVMNRDKPPNGAWGTIRSCLKGLVADGGLIAPGWGFGRRRK